MRRLTVLQPYEAKQFDLPPKFSRAERRHFFICDPVIQKLIDKARSDVNALGIILQYGYFKASGKFYTAEKFWPLDINFVIDLIDKTAIKNFAKQYAGNTRLNHKAQILSLCGYQRFSDHKALFNELTETLVSQQLAPRKIVFSLVDLLREKKIEVPQYDTFSTVIGATLNRYENNNIEKLHPLLTDPYQQTLMQLIEKEDQAYQRPLLIGLKTINQSVRPAKIKRSIHGFLIIKKLYQEVEPLIIGLGLSPEATRYYARWVIKAKTTQLSSMADMTQRCLYLLAFIAHQYKVWQDTFADILLKCVKAYLNKADAAVKKIIAEKQAEKNRLTDSVLQGYQQQFVSIRSAREVLYNERMKAIDKVNKLKEIIPKISPEGVGQQQQDADVLAGQLEQEKQQNDFYQVLETLSRKLQNRVSDIIKYLDFTVHESHEALCDALNHYQTKPITKSSPQAFLSDPERRSIFSTQGFNAGLYKAILFVHVANGVKSGIISLATSYRYMPLESYLVDHETWERDFHRILEKTNLEQFADIDTLLSEQATHNHERFYAVNSRIDSGDNKYVKVKKDDGFTVYTPGLDKPDYESFSTLIGKNRFIPILQMLAEANTLSRFTDCFTHHRIKGAHQPPSDEVFFAGIFALGSNIGLHKLASTARGITHTQLSHCVNWYFSLENLHAVNNSLTEAMNKLWLPDQFKKEKNLLHTSSDAQKRCVSAESLNANFSYKYFGHGSGSNIYTFIDERGILFYTTVFSSAERDAAYVIDGLLHNENIQSDMHSTDTHGYTDIIFGITHLMKVAFAPRLKDASSQMLVSFDNIRSDLAKDGSLVLPKHVVNQSIIKDNWNSILRLMATLKLHEHRASIIIKRLHSYTASHPLQAAMKEFGRIIKTAFLLEYFDDIELRQIIEKQLNKGELANKFSSAVTFANNEEILQVERDEQEVAAVCKMIIQNIIILWNYVELTKLIIRSDDTRKAEILQSVLSGSIIAWGHANLLGTYDFRNLISQNDDDISMEEVMDYKVA